MQIVAVCPLPDGALQLTNETARLIENPINKTDIERFSFSQFTRPFFLSAHQRSRGRDKLFHWLEIGK